MDIEDLEGGNPYYVSLVTSAGDTHNVGVLVRDDVLKQAREQFDEKGPMWPGMDLGQCAAVWVALSLVDPLVAFLLVEVTAEKLTLEEMRARADELKRNDPNGWSLFHDGHEVKA